MTKSPTVRLNEVLLNAAIRAERINADRLTDQRAQELARRNDDCVPHRVPLEAIGAVEG